MTCGAVFSIPAPCRTNDAAFKASAQQGSSPHLTYRRQRHPRRPKPAGVPPRFRGRLHPRRALPPRAPLLLCRVSRRIYHTADSDNPAGRSLRGRLRVSAVDCTRGGPCPLGLPCCSVTSPAASNTPQTATTPQAEACGVASAFPRLIAPEAGLAPSGSPAALLRLPPHLTYRRQRQPRRPKPAGLPLYAANAAVSIFCWDAGELRRGQITPTALPSCRQTAS